MAARPIKCGSQGRNKYFYPDQMGWCLPIRAWRIVRECKPRPIRGYIVLKRTNRKRQRRYDSYLCLNWLNE